MTPKEIKDLVKTLRSLGVTRYEANGIVFELGPKPEKKRPRTDSKDDSEIPHVINELTSVMKLGDNDLVNKLFPDTQEDDDEL